MLNGHDSIRSILEIVFPMGALMFYAALFEARLIPRWISGWGLAAAAIWLAIGLAGLFHLVPPMSPIQVLLSLPIFLQEMVMAVWLLVKGFNPTSLPEQATRGASPVDRIGPPVLQPR